MLFSDKKKMVFSLIAAVFFIFLDRFFKILALKAYSDKEVSLVGNLLKFTLEKNYNIAFSLPFSGLLLIILTAIIIIGLIYFSLILYKKQEYRYIPYLTFILFGAMSNLFDRVKYGYVIDYIDLKYFTVFNVADMMIVGGVIFLFLLNIKKIKDSKYV